MSLKIIKNVALAGCIGLAGLFATAANATSSVSTTGLGELGVGDSFDFAVTHGTNTDFIDTYTFSFNSSVPAAAVATVSFEVAPVVGINGFNAMLYDPTPTQITGTSSSDDFSNSFSFNVGSPIDGLYSLIISGETIGAATAYYTVGVSAVPLPAAAWLFISGFLAIAGWSKIKRKREQKDSLPAGALTA